MAFKLNFNEEKNQILKATRGICFDDVIVAIRKKNLLASIVHPSSRHSNQWMYIIEIEGYAYVVPYVKNAEKNEIFLKTVYASRFMTKKYIKRKIK